MQRTKFNVNKNGKDRTYDGIVFDSQLEMKYYRDVILPRARSGFITKYELQKPYELQPKFMCNGKSVRPIIYVADFYIEYADGSAEVIDTKGCPDSVAKIKKKLFQYKYPDVIYKWIIYIKKFGGWIDYDEYKRLKRIEKEAADKEQKEN